MFAHIRRHQKWLWIFISAAVIISFVWYFNPTQMQGGGGGGSADVSAQVGTIYGEPITVREYNEALREAHLDYLFRYGRWADTDEFARQMGIIPRETRNKLLLSRKLEDYNIEVDNKAAAEWISTFFADPQTKQFNPQYLDQILQTIGQKGISRADFERYVRNTVGLQHLLAVAGSAGKLVPPQEIERALRQENEKIDTKVAVLPLTNFFAKVQVTPEAIANYYTNAMARYRLPERMQLSYVAFPASNFFAQADQKLAAETNVNQQVDMIYMRRGANFYTGPDGQPLTADAAKQRIREELRTGLAMQEAQKAAFEFASALEATQVKPTPANPAEPLEQLAASKGLNAQVTQPYSQFDGPGEMPGLPDEFARATFQLTPEEPLIAEPLEGDDAYYMIALKRHVPSELQPLDTIRDQVTEDFRRGEALKLGREAATAFIAAATNAPNASFEAAAQQHGLMVVDLPPVTRQAADPIENLPPSLDAGALRSAISDLKPGEVSAYVPTREGGFVAKVENVIAPTNEEVQKDLSQFAQDYRRRHAAEAFQDWFGKQMQLAQLNLNIGDEETAQ